MPRGHYGFDQRALRQAHNAVTMSAVAFPADLVQQIDQQAQAMMLRQQFAPNQFACSVTTCTMTGAGAYIGGLIAPPEVHWTHHLDDAAMEELERLITTPVRERLVADAGRRLDERRREQERIYAEQLERAEKHRREVERQAKAANARATKLLREQLTVKQLSDMERHGHFTVITPLVGYPRQRREVRLRTQGAISGNVSVGGERYCVYPQLEDYGLPFADQLLGQKLMLEANPEAFFAQAVPRPRWLNPHHDEHRAPRDDPFAQLRVEREANLLDRLVQRVRGL